jgi:hypothetical protein
MIGQATLVLVFCLIGSPSSCIEQRPQLEPMTKMACLIEGQRYAADWLAEHPKWTLERWRCEDKRQPKRVPS